MSCYTIIIGQRSTWGLCKGLFLKESADFLVREGTCLLCCLFCLFVIVRLLVVFFLVRKELDYLNRLPERFASLFGWITNSLDICCARQSHCGFYFCVSHHQSGSDHSFGLPWRRSAQHEKRFGQAPFFYGTEIGHIHSPSLLNCLSLLRACLSLPLAADSYYSIITISSSITLFMLLVQ